MPLLKLVFSSSIFSCRRSLRRDVSKKHIFDGLGADALFQKVIERSRKMETEMESSHQPGDLLSSRTGLRYEDVKSVLGSGLHI